MRYREIAGLQRRGRSFRLRRRVPSDLVDRLGRRELILALGTDDQLPAAAICCGIVRALPAFWLWLRVTPPTISRDALNAIVTKWLKEELARQWRLFHKGGFAAAIVENASGEGRSEANRLFAEEAEASLERLSEDYKSGDYRSVVPVAKGLVATEQLPISSDTQEFGVLCKRLMEAKAEVNEARMRWAQGDVEYRPAQLEAPAQPAAGGGSSEPEPAAEIGSGRTLGDAIATHIELLKRERPRTPKQLSDIQGELNVLVDAFGAARPVAAVTRQDAGRVDEALSFLPKRWRADERLAGLEFFAKSQRARELGLTPLHPRTINSYLGQFSALFEREKRAGRCGENPFETMRANAPRSNQSQRAFTPNEIEAIFSSPLFLGAESSDRPYDPGAVKINDWRFWAPTIAYFTGMRVSEIAQLRPQDVKQIRSTWVFDISRDGGRRVKTEASIRCVPVHPKLIACGIVSLAAERGTQGTLLPSCPKPVGGDPGKQLSKWMCEKFLPRFGFANRPGIGFHSFRHGMATMLRSAGVEDRTADVVLGHVSPGVGARYGTFSIEVVEKAIRSIDVAKVVSNIPARLAGPAESARSE